MASLTLLKKRLANEVLVPTPFTRLYAKGRVLGFTRSKRNTKEHTSLLQLEGVRTSEDTQFYLGKRVAYVYRAKREIDGSRIRVIWGRITRAHGTSGAVRAKFRSNLPPRSFGAGVRVVGIFVPFGVGHGLGCGSEEVERVDSEVGGPRSVGRECSDPWWTVESAWRRCGQLG